MLKVITNTAHKAMQTYRWLKHLHMHQLWARAGYKARSFWYSTPLYPLTWETPTPLTEAQLTPANLWPTNTQHGKQIANTEFCFIGKTLNMRKKMRWLPREASHLWLFHLHYWDWLPDLLTQDEKGQRLAQEYLDDWVTLFGKRWHGVVWHPYPLSLRIVAWLTHAPTLLKDLPQETVQLFWDSLQHQITHLEDNLEWDLGGNHLIKNLKALVYAGLCLPGRQTLYLEALNLLLEQLSIQILPDGSHYERSPHYHAIVLEDLLDIHALLLKANQPIPPQLDDALERMGTVLATLRHPDGGLSLFNDSAIGNIAKLDALQARTGIPEHTPQHLADSGIVHITGGAWHMLLDAGKIAPDELVGHSHADTLSFEASLNSERVFVNSGTYAYQDKLRLPLRRTNAHNTVTIDDIDNAEVFGIFRAGRRPNKVSAEVLTEKNGTGITAEHNGYAHIGVHHTRRLFIDTEGHTIRGEDELQLKNKKQQKRLVNIHFHLAPGITFQLKNEQEVILTLADQKTHLRMVTKEGRWLDKSAIYAPQFGEKTSIQKLMIQARWQEGETLRLPWAIQQI